MLFKTAKNFIPNGLALSVQYFNVISSKLRNFAFTSYYVLQ